MSNVYCKELVYDPKYGTIENMGGQKTWRVGYFFEEHEPTGREVPCTGLDDDYEEEHKRTYRKEISKEEYERFK